MDVTSLADARPVHCCEISTADRLRIVGGSTVSHMWAPSRPPTLREGPAELKVAQPKKVPSTCKGWRFGLSFEFRFVEEQIIPSTASHFELSEGEEDSIARDCQHRDVSFNALYLEANWH